MGQKRGDVWYAYGMGMGMYVVCMCTGVPKRAVYRGNHRVFLMFSPVAGLFVTYHTVATRIIPAQFLPDKTLIISCIAVDWSADY